MPAPPSRRSGANGRRIQKKKGTPPAVLVAMIGVPTLLLICVLGYKEIASSGRQTEAPQERHDPNLDIKKLDNRFRDLNDRSQSVRRMDRESPEFKTKVQELKVQWEIWIRDYEKIFEPLRGADGSYPPEFEGYSALKGRAGLIRMDLIKMGDL